jgi:hypothetical protein
VSDDQDEPHATPVSKSPIGPSPIRRWSNLLAQRQSPHPSEQANNKDPLKTIVSALGGPGSGEKLAKLAKLAQGPSPEMTKVMEGVLAGIQQPSSTSPSDTLVGRFLTTLGGGFLTGSLTVSAAIAIKSDQPNWYALVALVVGCWIVGGFLIAAGLKWPKWKPNHEVLAKRTGAISSSIWAWSNRHLPRMRSGAARRT